MEHALLIEWHNKGSGSSCNIVETKWAYHHGSDSSSQFADLGLNVRRYVLDDHCPSF